MKVDSKKIAIKYLKLSKLRIVELLLITTVPSMVVSIYGFPPLELILFTVLGGTLLAVSANVLNQIFEILRIEFRKNLVVTTCPMKNVNVGNLVSPNLEFNKLN